MANVAGTSAPQVAKTMIVPCRTHRVLRCARNTLSLRVAKLRVCIRNRHGCNNYASDCRRRPGVSCPATFYSFWPSGAPPVDGPGQSLGRMNGAAAGARLLLVETYAGPKRERR